MCRPCLADHQHDLALIVELRGGARAHQRCVVADEGARRAHEHARIFRRVLAVLVLGIAVGIVDADADDLFRRGHRRQPDDVTERVIGRAAGGLFGEARELSCRDHLAQRRIVLGVARGEIDDAAIDDGAVADSTLDGKGGEAREVHWYYYSLSSRRRPGPIPRDLSIGEGRSTEQRVFAKLLPVIMGPGLRRDDGERALMVTRINPPPARRPRTSAHAGLARRTASPARTRSAGQVRPTMSGGADRAATSAAARGRDRR